MADDIDFEDIDLDQAIEEGGDTGESGQQQRKRKKRVRNWTAEDRARHRVFERSRREAFNERLSVSVAVSSRPRMRCTVWLLVERHSEIMEPGDLATGDSMLHYPQDD